MKKLITVLFLTGWTAAATAATIDFEEFTAGTNVLRVGASIDNEFSLSGGYIDFERTDSQAFALYGLDRSFAGFEIAGRRASDGT